MGNNGKKKSNSEPPAPPGPPPKDPGPPKEPESGTSLEELAQKPPEPKPEIVAMKPDQAAVMNRLDQKMRVGLINYAQIARRAGALQDQLEATRAQEKLARDELAQTENEHQKTVQEFADQLGHTEDQNWVYNAAGHCFAVHKK